MWITGLCAFWPPIPDTEISIQDTGLALNKEFSAPVTKSYLLTLNFFNSESNLATSPIGTSAKWRSTTKRSGHPGRPHVTGPNFKTALLTLAKNQ